MSTPYYSVHGHPFIDLEPHLDLSRLNIIAQEIAAYIVRRKEFAVIALTDKQDIHPGYQEDFDFDPLAFNPSEQVITGVGREGRAMFNTFFQPLLCLYGFRLRDLKVTEAHGPDCLEHVEHNHDSEHAEQLPHTMEFLRALPLRGLGRVTVYHTLPGMSVPAHRDFTEHPGFNTQFIWLNPFKKPFYVLDGKGEKQYVNTRAAIFNPNDFHGMDTCWKSCFSIRIDGFWDKHLKARVGLDEAYFGGRG